MTKQKHTTKITYKSIEQSLNKDYKKSLAEYIWNGFDANAKQVSIIYNANQLGYFHKLHIEDNGVGIDINTIDQTFGQFLDSQKQVSNTHNGIVKGKKGKGRFSFIGFCNQAIWKTTFKQENKQLSYDILLNKGTLPSFETSNKISSKTKKTGTTVEFNDFTELTADLLENEDFFDFLTAEFGWYLFLNRNENYSLNVNNTFIDYKDVIEYSVSDNFKYDNQEFKIDFVKWKRNIGDKYYYYFLNDSLKIVDRQHTSFNNKTEDFHHSVYINSPYFDNFLPSSKEDTNPTFSELGNTKNDRTFKALLQHLNHLVAEQEKNFVREKKAEKLIEDFRRKNIFPKFRNNSYDKIREQDLENVVKEIYCLNPKIFQGLKDPQSKTIVGFLNLLLDSEQRDNILTILESLIDLSDEERLEFAKVLEDTKVTHITALINELKNRFNTVMILKKLVFELEKFTNERDHIQKVIENNYWLFGEQYHLVSADVNFETTLNNYLSFIESGKKEKSYLTSKNKLKRPDIFIARKSQSNEVINDELSIEENIIVELKRPTVVIGKEQYDQIEAYIRFIISEPQFNSELRKWKLILIGKSVDEWIKDKYESQKNKGKKFLVESVKNYEIYAMRWDDLFKIFDIRHKHLIENLDFKETVIENFMESGDIEELPDILTENVLPF
ncbi:ATP-binding protein [Elizabethkingia anophelis]|uniref:ATP-binding protein n=1 Tax=Elizabethkingia anophelis TaxID=1117645 RepID=UPI003462997C